jgi:hypothetical protein
MKLLCWLFGHKYVNIGWDGAKPELKGCKRCQKISLS